MPRKQPRNTERSKTAKTAGQPAGRGERLQKVLAAAGVGSRRDCEELMLQGRVEVDGVFVTELGVRVDPVRQRIRVDGVALRRPRRVYFAVNKPPGVVCTSRDPSGRQRVVDLVRSDELLFTVGRLDRTSEGLILVTNDGELSNRLTHPRYGVQKVYRVRVAGHPPLEVLNKLREGVHLADGVARVASVKIKRRRRQSTELEIMLDEGRNREIRRLLARLRHKVLQLQRIAFGPLHLGDLPVGAYRKLSREEVDRLQRATRRQPPTTEKPRSAPRKRSRPASSESSSLPAVRKKKRVSPRKGQTGTARRKRAERRPAKGATPRSTRKATKKRSS